MLWCHPLLCAMYVLCTLCRQVAYVPTHTEAE